MFNVVREFVMSAILVAAGAIIVAECGIVVVDLLKDIIITIKKTFDEVKGK